MEFQPSVHDEGSLDPRTWSQLERAIQGELDARDFKNS